MDFQPQAKTGNAVYVIASIALRYARLGFRQILLIPTTAPSTTTP